MSVEVWVKLTQNVYPTDNNSNVVYSSLYKIYCGVLVNADIYQEFREPLNSL